MNINRFPVLAALAALLITASLLVGCTPSTIQLQTLSQWDIVIDDDAHPAVQYAADEFQHHYAAATGVTLPIRHEPIHQDHGRIFIGIVPLDTGSESRIEPSPESTTINVNPNVITLEGADPRGVIYAVYTFLEDNLGVRFLTSDHTHVPALQANDAMNVGRRHYEPPLNLRWSYYGEMQSNPIFATRLRNNTITKHDKFGGRVATRLINHSFGRYMPWKKFGQDHPEYYNKRDGKRPIDITNDQFNPGVQLCTTNPEVLRIVTAGVLADLAANPTIPNISVSQNDNEQYCQCAQCEAINQREGSPMGSLLTFVNAVADEVAKTHPDVLVGTLAYQYSRKPPKHLRPRPNVQIQLCSIECCVTHAIDDPDCPLNTPFCEDMKAWGQISDQISVWHYNTNFANYLLPSPNLSAIAPSIRYFVKHHARGVMMQGAYGSTGAEFADLRNYVTSRLLWNPSLDGDALIEEFLTLHYEAAADPIRDMLTTIYQQADASGKHERISRPGHLYGYDRALAEKSFEYIQQAKALAPNDTIRSRVEKLELYVTAMMVDALLDTDQPRTIYHRIYRKLAVAPHLSPEQLAEARPYIKHMFELAEHHHATMTSEWMTTAQAKAAFNAIHAPTGFERDEAAAADSD